jgi:hypothetical protein
MGILASNGAFGPQFLCPRRGDESCDAVWCCVVESERQLLALAASRRLPRMPPPRNDRRGISRTAHGSISVLAGPSVDDRQVDHAADQFGEHHQRRLGHAWWTASLRVTRCLQQVLSDPNVVRGRSSTTPASTGMDMGRVTRPYGGGNFEGGAESDGRSTKYGACAAGTLDLAVREAVLPAPGGAGTFRCNRGCRSECRLARRQRWAPSPAFPFPLPVIIVGGFPGYCHRWRRARHPPGNPRIHPHPRRCPWRPRCSAVLNSSSAAAHVDPRWGCGWTVGYWVPAGRPGFGWSGIPRPRRGWRWRYRHGRSADVGDLFGGQRGWPGDRCDGPGRGAGGRGCRADRHPTREQGYQVRRPDRRYRRVWLVGDVRPGRG